MCIDEYVQLLIFGGQISNNNSFFVILVVFLNYIGKMMVERKKENSFSQFKNWLKTFVIICPVWRKECGIKGKRIKNRK